MEKRIFISSVISGFTEQRKAAKLAVELLRQRPVMAEDFGAKPHSPQNACLDGVRSSDLFILILGRKYGTSSKSGLSATEEELNQARTQGIPILVFLEGIEREQQQEEFVNRISSYEDGFHRASFSTPGQLKDEIVKSLNDALDSGREAALSLGDAITVFNRLGWNQTRDRSDKCWLRLFLVPTRWEEYISLRRLEDSRFLKEIQKATLFGDSPIFDSELGIKLSESSTGVQFSQHDGREQSAILDARNDGVLLFGKRFCESRRNSTPIARGFVIDEREFSISVANFFATASWLYGTLNDSHRLTACYFAGTLSGIQFKVFGKLPAVETGSFTMGNQNLPDPLRFPEEPILLARAKLIDSKTTAEEITRQVARMFRLAGAYRADDGIRI